MWISSLVVTLDGSPVDSAVDSPSDFKTPLRPDAQTRSDVQAAIREMQAIPSLTVGVPVGNRLPVVVEAERNESRYWHDWIGQLPGVIQVEVAFVSFEEVE